MNTPDPRREPPLSPVDMEARVQKWRELQAEMELLHARLVYVKLMLKMGVKAAQPPK